MANEEHVALLKKGIKEWNECRQTGRLIQADLSWSDFSRANLIGADLIRANLSGANLSGADLRKANLRDTNLRRTDLSGANLHRARLRDANLSGADLSGADLSEADLSRAVLNEAVLNEADLSGAGLSGAVLNKADLSDANLSGADLSRADLRGADLTKANLRGTLLLKTNLCAATLTDCSVYGASVWAVQLDGSEQKNLRITAYDEPMITVHNLKVAQFIHLLLNNEEVRDVIDTITSKAVLILGRFTPERKAVLDAIREELRRRNYLPILFDFEKPASRDITETVMTLASMTRFIIADITDAKSIPQELMVVVPNLPSVPVQPLLQKGAGEYGMFEHFKRFPWVLDAHLYEDTDGLIASLADKVIGPAEIKAKELSPKK